MLSETSRPWSAHWFRGFFLFAIALVNLVVLLLIYRAFVRVRRGEPEMWTRDLTCC